MHRARAFFFVCLGILCLVAAYHFGATSATAQAQVIEGAACVGGDGTGWGFCGAINRVLWYYGGAGPLQRLGPPIPGTSPVIATYCSPRMTYSMALLADGSTYLLRSGDEAWMSCVNLLGNGPVQTVTPTWGQLKAKYATPATTE